jgi:intein/homing endonuclease
MKPPKNIKALFQKLVNPMPEGEAHARPAKVASSGPLLLKDVIAPPAIEVDFDHLKIGDRYTRTLFVAGYPRFVSANWLEPLISFNHTLNISMFVYPTKSEEVLENLKRKVGEMEATIQSDLKRGRVIEPSIQVALEDALGLQQELAKGAQRFFQFGLYVTIPAVTKEDLDKTTKQIEATLGSLLIVSKKAILQMEEGFKTTLPTGQDRMVITRNMDTTSLATTFPFTTSELSANEGILYGINEGNESLIIFDRFSLENANAVVFGKSIAGGEPVLVRINNTVQLLPIGKLVDSLIEKHGVTHRDDELEGVRNPNVEVFSFGKSLTGGWSKVQLAARKEFSPQERLYAVTTKSGRQITMTADHCLVTLRGGRIVALRGQDIKRGDALPVPRSIPESSRAPKVVLPKDLVPQWPEALPKRIPVATALLSLLGLTTSEGLVREGVLNIYNTDPTVLGVIRASAEAIGAHVAPRYATSKICGYNIAPNVFAKLFIALGAGGSSGTKRVPPFLFSATNRQIAAYLSAYFEGDGTVSANEVSCTSKSRKLISDITYLLLRFGIVGRTRIKHKRATNSTASAGTYWELVVSGATNLQSFANAIGFITERKKKKLAAILGKAPNTNVDVIPTLVPMFQQLYRMLYQGDAVHMPINLSPLKRGAFTPSPALLRETIVAMENRVAALRSIRKNIQFLRRLPALDDIVHRGSRRKLNRLLWAELGHSWQLMKQARVAPGAVNVLRAHKTITGEDIALPEVKRVLYETFRETGVSLESYNRSLHAGLVREARKPGDTRYATLKDAAIIIARKYRSIQLTIRHAEKLLSKLRLLANADLFWDPVVRIEKLQHQEHHVYDLVVDSGVFLAGTGGLFVHNSGSGKSYMVKLEVMRSLMFDTEVIIIDPENEYEALSYAMGGEYIQFRFGTTTKINPFDLAVLAKQGSEESELNQKILSLHGFFRVVMGQLTPTEDALLDRALILTYKQKGITPDPATQTREPPLMEDLYKTLVGMEEGLAKGLADRIEKFVKGSLVGIFDQQTNIEIRNHLTVFSIRDLEDELRPIAMYLILDFIWTKIRKNIKRRLLIVDEAWYMMKYPDSANFLNSIAKRARKYYLGVTTITQDAEDFLEGELGRAIIQNSSMQILLKQSAAAIDKIADVFYLSEGEKHLLLSADIGEGLFFAGPAHAAMRVIASLEEHELATTKPQELEKRAKDAKSAQEEAAVAPSQPAPPPAPGPVPNRPIFTVEQVNAATQK